MSPSSFTKNLKIVKNASRLVTASKHPVEHMHYGESHREKQDHKGNSEMPETNNKLRFK